MKIICDTCGAKYSIADEKVRGKVFKIRCKKCSEIIVVRGTADAPAAAEEPAAGGAGYGGEAYGGASDAVWHVVLDGEQQGPYTAEQVGQFVAAGHLDYESYSWRDGFADWMHLRDVPELMQVLGGAVHASAPPAAGAGSYQDQMPTVATGAADPYAGYGGVAAAQQPAGGMGYGGEDAGPFDGADTVLAPQEPLGFRPAPCPGRPRRRRWPTCSARSPRAGIPPRARGRASRPPRRLPRPPAALRIPGPTCSRGRTTAGACSPPTAPRT
jgi:predicted Zn finger-like uncharacterized protein